VRSAIRQRLLRALAAALALAATACEAGPEPPNILLVTIDTLRRDHVGAYGDTRALTPNLDALAADGLVHANAYTTMPTTGPAHLSIFTGHYPSELGTRRNGEQLPARFATRELGYRLGRRGYRTAAFVTARLLANGVVGLRGFDVYDAPNAVLRPGDDAVGDALAWLAVEKRRPVFLWVHLYDPHAPYGTADEKGRSFPVDPADYGFVDAERYRDLDRRRALEARYRRGVESADAALGKLLAGTREILGADLFVAVTTDHGEALSEWLDTRGFGFDHGKFLDTEEVRIPLVLNGPGIAAGRSHGAVSLRDLYTTLLAVAGIDDGDSETEQRRDLRSPDSTRRIVRIERREFHSRMPESVRGHAAAAADGAALVIVAEDGRPAAANPPPPPDLLSAARSSLAGLNDDGPAEEIPRETREALRDLGYVE
jgi:arylsulfatase A-like enzyme